LWLSEAQETQKPAKIGNFGIKPKKSVEIRSFLIDFVHPKAALLRTAGYFVAA
jgi:hypothetical protein